MPVEIAPNRIDLSALDGGYAPDAVEAGVPMNASPDVLNLIGMPWTNELRLRNGFSRLSGSRVTALSASHYIRHVNYYETVNDARTRKRYLICVLSDGSGSADNVRLYAYDLDAATFTRIDTPGRTWSHPTWEHWHTIVQGTYYGGSIAEVAYSWHPDDGWDASPTTPTAGTWIAGESPGGGEYAHDFAFKKGTKVKKSGVYYTAARNLRFQQWVSGTHYGRGEQVSRHVDEGGGAYWHSYRAIKAHTAGVPGDDQPGSGASYGTYWKKLFLDDVTDVDDELTDDWFLNPVPRTTNVGSYHGFRLFLAGPNGTGEGRTHGSVQYSAPAIPRKGQVISTLTFDPTDWAAADDLDGEGGGWFEVPFSRKGEEVRSMYSFGNYLIISGWWESFVLSGTNEQTWTLRQLGQHGAVNADAVAEVDGLIYMLDKRGVLTVTDGTTMQAAPGVEKTRKYIKDKLDHAFGHGSTNWYPSLEAHDGFIFIIIPHPTANSSTTIVYDPRSQAFWPTDIPMLNAAQGVADGVERFYFSTPITGAASQVPTLFSYLDDPGNEAYTDDDWQAISGTASTTAISWRHRSSWFQWGMTHNMRRLRRAWALIRGYAGSTVTLKVYRDLDTTAAETTNDTTVVGHEAGEWAEAKVGQSARPGGSFALRLSGTASHVFSLIGYGLDTEPIRTRFHRR